MYKIEKGILTENGKKLFALGQSYYPSFHYAKYPVPPEGDRIGEMQKDLAMMAQMVTTVFQYFFNVCTKTESISLPPRP